MVQRKQQCIICFLCKVLFKRNDSERTDVIEQNFASKIQLMSFWNWIEIAKDIPIKYWIRYIFV